MLFQLSDDSGLYYERTTNYDFNKKHTLVCTVYYYFFCVRMYMKEERLPYSIF